MSAVVFSGDTSGQISVEPPAVAGSNTLTLPAATDTLVGKATTDALTNKTYNGNTWTAGAATLTLGGNFVTSGAYDLTATLTANTSVTLPTTGTLATRAGSEALTNKTYNGNTWTAGASTLTLAGNFVTSGAWNLTATLTANTSVTFPTSGTLSVNPTMTSKTANYQIVAADDPSDFDNTGAVGAVTFTLPASVVGDVFSFTATEVQTLVVTAPGGVIIYAGDLASTSGGSFTATTRGAYLLLKCRSATTWYAQAILGTWTPT